MTDEPIKYFRRSEIKNNNETNSTRIIIHNNVYDVTEFLNEHPGGEEVLVEHAGKDATEAFEDVNHSKEAREMMNKYKIGELYKEERKETAEKTIKDWSEKKSDDHGSWKSWMIPIALAVLATMIYRFYFQSH